MGKFKMAALMAGQLVDLFIDFHCFFIEIWFKLQLVIEKYIHTYIHTYFIWTAPCLGLFCRQYRQVITWIYPNMLKTKSYKFNK